MGLISGLLNRNRRRAGAKANGRFNFCLPIWGQRYVEAFLEASLPSQLAAGNLLGFPWLGDSIYEVYTTEIDRIALERHPSFRKLRSIIDVRFIMIDRLRTRGQWNVFRRCQQMGVQATDRRDAAIFFLCSDQIWADGSFRNAAQHIMDGRSAVLSPGFRTVEETLVPALRRDWLSADGTTLQVPPRALVAAGLEHLHPDTRAWFWNDPDYYRAPTYIIFPVAGGGALAFCYILHPVVINPEVRNAPLRFIFDQDYLVEACPDVDNIYIAQDSDEIISFEISPANNYSFSQPKFDGDPIETLRWWGEWGHFEHHRRFVNQPVRIHGGACTPEAWDDARAQGEQIIDLIGQGWKLSDAELLATSPLQLLMRIKARNRFAPHAMSLFDRRLVILAKQNANGRRAGFGRSH